MVGRGFIPGIESLPRTGPSGPDVCCYANLMSTYALTTATYERRALFIRTANAELVVNALFHYREEGRYLLRRYLLHGFVVMPEHIHVLLTPGERQTIERC